MGDHGEVGEVALNAGVQDGLGPRVAEGRAVLVQELHQLLGNHSKTKRKIGYKCYQLQRRLELHTV